MTPIDKLSKVLGYLQEVHPDISIEQIKTFLLVSQNEGLAGIEYARLAAIPQTTISRQLLDLGERNRKKEEGLGLVEARRDVQDYRRWLYRLTPRGRKLIKLISDVIG